MKSIDPILSALMQPGAPFEVVTANVNGQTMGVYRQASETLPEIFDEARKYSGADFIVLDDVRLTYDDFFQRVDGLATWLQSEAKITAGISVGLAMKNSPEWMIAFVAILYIGAVPVLINSRATGAVMGDGLTDTDCCFVIADEKRLSLLEAAGCSLSSLRSGADFDAACKMSPAFERRPRLADDSAAMFFTSGTTGRAKAAVMTHRNLVTGLMNTQLAISAVFSRMAAQYGMDMETLRANLPQNSSLLVFPLFHTSGCSAVFLTAIASGGKLVLMNRWDADEALRLIESESVMGFGGVPAMHWDLVNAAKGTKRDLSSLKSISNGGQALPLGLLKKMQQTFPGVVIGAGYGLTETSGAVSQANGEGFTNRPEASGHVLSMVQVQVTDDEGQVLEPGSVGEIRVKGPTVMKEYYGRPEANALAFDKGWFKTGDVGFIDEDDYLHIVDRKTDMVISGGENIYCAEIEQVFSKCEGVRQAVAFGVPDERLGERLVVAFAVSDTDVTPERLVAYAEVNLGGYKMPSDYILQSEPFALNAMGKAQKQDVRRAYLSKGQ